MPIQTIYIFVGYYITRGFCEIKMLYSLFQQLKLTQCNLINIGSGNGIGSAYVAWWPQAMNWRWRLLIHDDAMK